MSTIREQIVQAAVAALNTETPAGVPTAQRAVTLALDPSQMPAIIVYMGPKDRVADVGSKSGALRTRALRLTVECYACATETLGADAAADPLTAWVIKALEDNHLGGLVTGLREEETDFALERADQAVCLASIKMAAEYTHKAGDLEVIA